jgi:signal transduction histidine kinase
MKFLNSLRKSISFDPYSLRIRLSVGIATISAVGLGSVAMWTSWQMQQILIDSHKQSITAITLRLPHDVEVYSDMLPVETGLVKAVDNLTTSHTLLWVKNAEGKILAESVALKNPADRTSAELMSLAQMPLRPQVYPVNGGYFVLCTTELSVKGKILGQLFVAQDITRDQTMFLAVVQSLAIATLLSILAITLAIALYVRRSLQPLRQMSQLAGSISPENLGAAELQLAHAPSEVKELAQMLEMMLLRLSQAWEQQRQFTSNASHELRTPLTIVHGYLHSVLRRETNLTDTQREALSTAAAEADRTVQLLQDLLDLARTDTDILQHRSPIVLNELLLEVAGMAEQYSNRPISIEAKIGLVEVKANRNRLKQVLLNLIDNAIKYSESSQPVKVKLNQLGKQVIIQVCDRGSGIPLAEQSRIFERFYRLDEARARSTGGYGLGLAIVKTSIESMGGKIAVHSKLGEGSTFTITLPAD